MSVASAASVAYAEPTPESNNLFKIYALAQNPEDDTLISDLFHANPEDNVISCPNPQFTEINTFRTAYCAAVEPRKPVEPPLNALEFMPLVESVVAGKSASVIVGGTAKDIVRNSTTAMRYISTGDRLKGLIEALTAQLIDKAKSSESKEYALTLSWHAIDCVEEGVVDVLKCASEQSSTDPADARSRPRNIVEADPTLVLRNLGKGRGVCVPGLWEVAIQSAQDAAAIVSQVWEAVERLLRQHVHTFNLTYTSGCAIGRLFVICLTSLDSTSTQPAPQGQTHPWARVLQMSIDAVIQRRPAPPFHRSRSVSLMRDALTAHMPSRLLLFVSTGIDTLPLTWRWLQLATAVQDCVTICSKAVAVKEKLQSSLVTTEPAIVSAVEAPAAVKGMIPGTGTGAGTALNSNGNATISQELKANGETSQHRVSFQEDTPQAPPPPPAQQSQPVRPAIAVERSRQHPSTRQQMREATPTVLTNLPTATTQRANNLPAAARRPASTQKQRDVKFAEKEVRAPSNDHTRANRSNGRNPASRQSNAALSDALHSSQAEVQQLRAAVERLQEENQELQEENRSLLELQAGMKDTAFARRLQGKLRKAMKELKEYEVYRSVMESSVANNERQIAQLTQENTALKKKLDQSLKAARATRNDHNATLQELMTLRRELTATEARLQGVSELNDTADANRASIKAERDTLAKEVQQLRAKLSQQAAETSTTIEMLKKDLQSTKQRLQNA